MNCPKCGRSGIPSTAKWCGRCGSKLPRTNRRARDFAAGIVTTLFVIGLCSGVYKWSKLQAPRPLAPSTATTPAVPAVAITPAVAAVTDTTPEACTVYVEPKLTQCKQAWKKLSALPVREIYCQNIRDEHDNGGEGGPEGFAAMGKTITRLQSEYKLSVEESHEALVIMAARNRRLDRAQSLDEAIDICNER